MHVAIYLPLLVAAVLGATATHLSRALPPATATRLLAGAGVATATATSFVLGVLTFTLVAEFGPVARLGLLVDVGGSTRRTRCRTAHRSRQAPRCACSLFSLYVRWFAVCGPPLRPVGCAASWAVNPATSWSSTAPMSGSSPCPHCAGASWPRARCSRRCPPTSGVLCWRTRPHICATTTTDTGWPPSWPPRSTRCCGRWPAASTTRPSDGPTRRQQERSVTAGRRARTRPLRTRAAAARAGGGGRHPCTARRSGRFSTGPPRRGAARARTSPSAAARRRRRGLARRHDGGRRGDAAGHGAPVRERQPQRRRRALRLMVGCAAG